jgi:hypothetical protein
MHKELLKNDAELKSGMILPCAAHSTSLRAGR